MSDTTSFTELVPTTGRVVDLLRDITDEPRSALADRPWVYSNMVTSLDGAISIDGLSGSARRPRRPGALRRCVRSPTSSSSGPPPRSRRTTDPRATATPPPEWREANNPGQPSPSSR
ncbi:MAG: hypothetical protein R2710_13015 [Acidimicrobiales bacterium]